MFDYILNSQDLYSSIMIKVIIDPDLKQYLEITKKQLSSLPQHINGNSKAAL